MSTLRSFKSLPDLLVARELDSGGGQVSTGEEGGLGRRNLWFCEDTQKGFISRRDHWGGGGGEDVEGSLYRISRSTRIDNYKAGAGFTQCNVSLYLAYTVKCHHVLKHIEMCSWPFCF